MRGLGLLVALYFVLVSSAAFAANSDCACAPDVVLPGGNIAKLRDVSTSGKASKVAVSVTIRLKAIDVTPGSCSGGETSDPVLVALNLVDDDGDTIVNRTETGFVCTAGEKTHAKFTAVFEGPLNCKDSAVPNGQSSGRITGSAATDDGAILISRKILCAEAVPVSFDFSSPPNYHVTAGDTLNFSVTAKRRGGPLAINASGLPPSASFDGANFSWVGSFVDSFDDGNHDITFSADGESVTVNIATTENPVTGMTMVDLSAQNVTNLPVPVGGQALVSVQPQFDNEFGVPTIGGQGTNAWNDFVWSIDATYLADVSSSTNVAVIDGMGDGTTQIHASFTDATLGVVTASADLDVLEVVAVEMNPASLSLPAGSTEPVIAIATLEGGAQTSRVAYNWQTSNSGVATVVEGVVLGTANVTAHALGSATITAFTSSGPVVADMMPTTAVSPIRSEELFGMNEQPAGNQVVSIDTAGNSQLHATMLAPYDDQFCASSYHDANELLVGSFQQSTGFSQIQRIDSGGNASVVFTSTTITPLGDTVDVEAIRYRPDGDAYFAMSEDQHTLSVINDLNEITKIGGPSGNDGFGPIAIAPFGNAMVYSGPWGVELLGQGNKLEGFAELIALYDGGSPSSNEFIARSGVSQPRLVAPGGDLWVLDGGTGELFRFEDLDSDGDHYWIETTSSMGVTTQTARDDPGERISAGQLPVGFRQLHLDPTTGEVIATRVVGTVPQRITVMRVADLNSDGDVNDAGEQAVVFDAGSPPGTDITDVLLQH